MGEEQREAVGELGTEKEGEKISSVQSFIQLYWRFLPGRFTLKLIARIAVSDPLIWKFLASLYFLSK